MAESAPHVARKSERRGALSHLLALPRLTSKQYGIYVALASLPVVAACAAIQTTHPFHVIQFLSLLAVAIVVSFFPVPVSRMGVYMSAVLPVAMAAAYRCGPLSAIAIELVAVVIQVIAVNRAGIAKRPKTVMWSLLHNASNQIIAVGAVAVAFQLAIDNNLFRQHSLTCALAITLASLLSYYISAFLVTTVASKAFAARWDIVWFENYRWTSRGALFMAPIGFIAGALSEQNILYGVAMIVMPLVAAQRGFALHVRKVAVYRHSVDLLGRLMQEAHPYTHGHLHRVASWARKIAERSGLSASTMAFMEDAAILHDIGKIAIDDRVLNKLGTLNEHDWAIIKQHPETGAGIVERMRYLDHVARWIRHHHERFDGTGYPDGLVGEAIPIESRIIAVVDAFDAMVGGPSKEEQRPYRRPLTFGAACDELRRCAGTQFDPDIVRTFIAILEEDGAETSAPQRFRPQPEPAELTHTVPFLEVSNL